MITVDLLCVTDTIGGKSLRVGTTLQTRRVFKTCTPNCSRICCGVWRKTWRSRCRQRWSRYCESRCQTSRKSTTSEYVRKRSRALAFAGPNSLEFTTRVLGMTSFDMTWNQGSHTSWKVLDFFSWKFQDLENHFGPGKFWKLKFKVLESTGKISLKVMHFSSGSNGKQAAIA